jgi:hypothetical protein
MTISALSTTSSLDIIPVLAPFSDRSLLPSWCPNWFALDESSVSRQTNYLIRKSPILSQRSYLDGGEPVPHLTTVGTEAEFTVTKDVLYNDIVRLKGLLLDHIATIIRSHVGNGEGVAVAADPPLPGTLENNPYGTEVGLVTAIAKSLACGGFWFEYCEDFLRKVYEYWGESCQDSWFFTATDLTDDYEYARRWIRAAGSLLIQGRSLSEWINRHPFDAGFVERCREYAKYSTKDIVRYLAKAKAEGVAYMSTRGGYVGWAHKRAEPGDNIYLIAGCSVPVVLRRRAGGGYTIVGYTHVQGVMGGQIMELELKSKETRGSWEENWVDLDIY